ncbi:MAG: hypothetical protein AAGB51_08755 [Planctomycetota bacterium]
MAWVLVAAAGLCACAERDAGPLRVDRVLGEGGTQPGQFSYPRAICVAGPWLAVVDKSARIQLLDPETGEAAHVWRTPESELGKPTGLGFGPAPEGSADPGVPALYVADTHYHRVLVYRLPEIAGPSDRAPELLASFGSLGREGGQFIYLTDVAVLTSSDGARVDRIFVGEYGGNDRVSIFDGSMNFVRTFGRFGTKAEAAVGEVVFDRPQAVEVDQRSRRVLVGDAANHRVGMFSEDGDLIAWYEGGEERLNYPYGLAPIGRDRWLISEYGGGRIREVELDGSGTRRIMGEPGRGPGQLATPWGVAAFGGELFVLDSGNNRVLAVDAPGMRLGAGR